MYLTHKEYIKPNIKLADLVNDNIYLLLLMEHFKITNAINDKTVEQICNEYNIHLQTFLLISNLYNGFYPNKEEVQETNIDIYTLMQFLHNNHIYYRNKFPEIQQNIKELYKSEEYNDIKQIEIFFNTYLQEVSDHLKYEEENAFPYFLYLIGKNENNKTQFTVNKYIKHHTDIETKLSDIKNLLLKHISLQNSFTLKRKILNNLFELENELLIHAIIEERILVPLIQEIENKKA